MSKTTETPGDDAVVDNPGARKNPFRGAAAPAEVRARTDKSRRLLAADELMAFADLIERAPFGVYLVDSDFRIAHMNAAARAGAFQNVRPVIGRDFSEAMRILWPDDVASMIIGEFRKTLETGEPYYSKDYRYPRADVDATEAYEWELHQTAAPDGRPAVICYYYDSSKLRDVDAALRQSEERLKLATDGAGAGVWDHDLTTMKFVWSTRHCEMFGVSKDIRPGFGTWRDRVHPDDLRDVLAEFQRSKTTNTAFRAQYRIARDDTGEERWIEDAGRYFYDHNGVAVRCAGIVLDITAKRRGEEALRESRHALANELQATQALQRISVEMISEENITALYEKVLDAAVAIMGSDFASMQMLYPDRGEAGEMKLLGGRGFSGEALKFWEWVRADSLSACAVALTTNRRCIIPDVAECDFMAGTPEQQAHLDAGFRAVQSTPLLARDGRLIGMISTHWRKPHQPTERDLNLFDVLARQAADVIERNLAREEIRAGEAFNRRLLAASVDCIKVLELDGRLVSMSEGGMKALGIADATSLIGREWPEFFAEGRGLAQAAVNAAAAGRGESFEGMVPTVAGEERWWDTSVTPVPGADGRPEKLLAISRDITHRKDAERRQKLLLDELNHRVKNTLATVQSIALLTLKKEDSPEEQIAAFNARLIALAAAHNVLTRKHWEGADIREVIDGVLKPYGAARKRFSIEGPALHLRPKAVLAISLALHELATNALKYGALSDEKGRVAVAWTGDGGAFHLSWLESGGPEVKAPKRRSFGSRLIEEGLARDVGGEVELSFAKAGVVCAIKAPLEEMTGPRA